MRKLILIFLFTIFYSSHSFSICKWNPNPIGNVYVPNQTIYVQYDSKEAILKVIDIPITSNNFSFSTNDSTTCDFNFMGGWMPTWGTNAYGLEGKMRQSNIPGIVILVDFYYSSPQLGTGIKPVRFYDYHVPSKLSFTNMAWKLTIKQVAPISKSGTLQSGLITYLRMTNQWGTDVLDSGNIYFQNNLLISVVNCSIKNKTLTINMGDWYDTQFKHTGDTSELVDIPINLSCLAGTNIKVTVTSNIIENVNNGLLGLSGTDKATGVALQLLDNSNNPIVLNKKWTQQDGVPQGDYIFNWKARYIKTADKITPGSANASATVNIRYE